MILKNNTTLSDEYLTCILQECVDGYHALYPPASSTVEFIIFDSKEEMKKLRDQLTGDLNDKKDYDGNFLAPDKRTDVLTILALIKEKNIKGAEQYYFEKENGSLRDSVDDETEANKEPNPARVARGERLMAFFEFAEMIQHEYSHLCSYERFMEATDWEDPLFAGHDWNYHLHDELIARYRGSRAMLNMAEPYAEKNLLYSLWMGYWNDLNKDFKEHNDAVRKLLSEHSRGVEAEMLMFMKQNGLTSSDMTSELESKLGHPLHFAGQLKDSGVPRMSPIEVAEFLTFEDTEKRTIPLMYAIRNPYASYQGAQLLGLIQAFHDHLCTDDGLELDDVGLDLNTVMSTPFYEYVDAAKSKRTLERFIELFTKMATE